MGIKTWEVLFLKGVKSIKNNGIRVTWGKTKNALKQKKYRGIDMFESILLQYELYGNNFLPDENSSAADLKKVFKKSKEQKVTHEESVDIVICVYNAYEDVKKCIESVFKHTTKPYRVIIVDDNSAELTKTYLESVNEANKNVLLIRNESDKHGYTYAANIGLRASTATYVVLLNSDTIVTENWIDKMIDCAKTKDADLIGPLSNTASWQSIPRLTDNDGDWCHNELPEDMTVSDMGKLVESVSDNVYPIVPLLNGFCMMLSRKAIDILGYFDEENFGRGFSEEDDYNCRAAKAGLKAAIADNTYIFHAQSKSYSDEKRLALCKVSGERLREKHGTEYIETSCWFMQNNYMLDSIRARMEMELERRQLISDAQKVYSGKSLLILLPTSNASGGANVIIQEAKCMIKMGVKVIIMNLQCNKEAFEIAYEGLNIPVIYVESFKAVEKYAKDFDAVCCSLYSTVKYCDFKDRNIKTKVAYYVQDYEPYFFEEKNADWKEAVESYTYLKNSVKVTKTNWNAEEVKINTGADCTVIGPSVNVDLFRPRRVGRNTDKVVITAMLRPMTARRGPEMTYRVLRNIWMKYGKKVQINFFGCDPTKEYETALFFNKEKADFDFTNYGLLSPEETAILLSQTDIFVDFSTFQAMGLTAMEAMASGCTTVVTKFGGGIDFAEHDKNSVMIDTTDYDACYSTVESLINNPEFCDYLSREAYKSMCKFYPDKAAYNMLQAVFAEI